MEAIRPIETTYNQTRFRSRLEARWARLFDALGVEWAYEHEGYETPHGRYLPDFWLPQVDTGTAHGVLFEVKPADWSDDIENHPELLNPTVEDWLPVTPHLALHRVATELGVGAVLARGFRYDGQFWPGVEQIVPQWDHPLMLDVCGCGVVSFRIAVGHYLHRPHCAKSNPRSSASRVWTAYRMASTHRFWEGK